MLRSARSDGAPVDVPATVREYLRDRFYTDTAVPTAGALPLAIETYGADKILFATDSPYASPRDRPAKLVDACDAGDVIVAARVPNLTLPGATAARASGVGRSR
jgi:Amidohydrolase